MNSWRPYPLLRLVFPFVAGILVEIVIGSKPGLVLWITAAMAVLLAVSQLLHVTMSIYHLRWIPGLATMAFFLLAGYGIASTSRPENDADFLANFHDGFYIATVTDPPARSVSGIRAVLKVGFFQEKGRWKRTCGKAAGYLKYKTIPPQIQYGDHVILHAGFTEIRDNSNPNSFNYSRYLRNKGISHRFFAESYCWKRIGFQASGVFLRMALQVRDRLLDILRDNHVTGKEFAVAAALLLGYVDDLDPELRNDYAATGAMHILSVSGMHVGIIYIFLEFLLGFMNKNRPGRLIKAILLLAFIWFYAMLTGLSPCVLRSAAMLSLPILGRSLNRSPDMYNIIAASLLFILAMDPFLLLDVGFQLSYLAVAGIVVLYKPIYDLYVTSAWLADKIWSILAVSIAAQVATLPITLYTFHQFPNYFMLTNIFVVPLSSLIIYVGILVLASGAIPVVSAIFAKLLVFLIWSLNSVIHLIEELPCSTIRGIFISQPDMLLLYLAIVMMFLFLTLRRIPFLYLLIVSVIMLNLLYLDFQVHRLKIARMVIFNTGHDALYLFSTQDKAVLFYGHTPGRGGSLTRSGHELAMADMNAHGIHHHRVLWSGVRCRPPLVAGTFVPLVVSGRFTWFAGCRIAVLSGRIPKGLNRQVRVGILILSGNPKVSVADAIRIFHPRQIIIDATNTRYWTMQWIRDGAILDAEIHAVTENGAFQKEF